MLILTGFIIFINILDGVKKRKSYANHWDKNLTDFAAESRKCACYDTMLWSSNNNISDGHRLVAGVVKLTRKINIILSISVCANATENRKTKKRNGTGLMKRRCVCIMGIIIIWNIMFFFFLQQSWCTVNDDGDSERTLRDGEKNS